MKYSEIRKTAQSFYEFNRPMSFSAKMDIFDHHFPDNPLLPGALSALLLAESCGQENWSLKRISGLRFRKPLTPDLPVTMNCSVIQESPTERRCSGAILTGTDTIADGEFTFSKELLPKVRDARPEPKTCLMTGSQIRRYLPHGERIVLMDQLAQAHYPREIQDIIAGQDTAALDQSKLVGTKVHTRTELRPDNFWLDQKVLPSPILSELVAQAGALTLAPFFLGTKPQVSLLGCDTEYFAVAKEGSTIDTFVELTRVKRLGKSGNMIVFKSECYIGQTKIAQVDLNAMAVF